MATSPFGGTSGANPRLLLRQRQVFALFGRDGVCFDWERVTVRFLQYGVYAELLGVSLLELSPLRASGGHSAAERDACNRLSVNWTVRVERSRCAAASAPGVLT